MKALDKSNDQLPMGDELIIRRASNHIRKHYVRGQHHVACVLQCGNQIYNSLHLDSFGHDICAEPTALVNAISAGECDFLKLVSVFWTGNKNETPQVVAPCGNCRQILAEYAPKLLVVCPTERGTGVEVRTASELLPLTYKKPGGEE